MTRYCCGFMFSEDSSHVALIRKNRPEWQAGKLNGIGGHVEDGELYVQAMWREFGEETGYDEHVEWDRFATINGPESTIAFFRSQGPLELLRTMTDEEIVVACTWMLPLNVVPNLHWLIRLAMDPQVRRADVTFHQNTTGVGG